MNKTDKNIINKSTHNKFNYDFLADRKNTISNVILNSINEGIILTDLEGFIVSSNKFSIELFKYNSVDEIKNINITDLFSGDNFEEVNLILENVVKNSSVLKEKLTCISKIGTRFSVKINSILLNDDNGIPSGILFIINDISEITKANEQLRLLVTALESAANEVVITDNMGDVIWVNSSFSNVSGYSYSEILGQNPRILKSGMHNANFYSDLWNTISSGRIWNGEIINKKKNGDIYVEEMTITPLKNNNGDIQNYVAIKQDVTEKKNVEQNLLESELKYRSLFENSTIGIYRANSEGEILVANNRFLEILGLSSIEELKNVNVDEKFYQTASNRNKFQKILKSELKIYAFESQWKRKDGKLIYLRESASAFKNINGDVDFYEGTVEDITDIVLAKKEIDKQTDIFSALRYASEIFLRGTHWSKNIKDVAEQIGMAFDVSSVFICKKEMNNKNEIIFDNVANWNNPTSKYNTPNILPLNLNEHGLQRWAELLEENNIISGTLNEFSDNEYKFLAAFEVKSIILVPILFDGIFWGAIVFHQCDYGRVWTDSEIEALRAAAETISSAIKRHNFENELINAKKEAENADQTKSEFLAQISHEIRTPLNNITSFNTLIKEQIKDNIDDDIQECFDIIDSASNRLIRTIGLILNLSELHTGSYKPKFTNLDVYADVLEKLYLENRFTAKQKGINFILNNKANSTIVQADKYSLEQIFSNLINNSLKYTSTGKIEIIVENNKSNQIIINITDTGIGIAKDYLPNIFKYFSQEEGGYTRKYDGNGIGLSLVKEYCNLNNIKVNVTSEKNIGTTFTLILNNKK